MIRVVLPYLFLCHLPKRHMMSNFLYSFINFLYSSWFQRDNFNPLVFRLFLIQLQLKKERSTEVLSVDG